MQDSPQISESDYDHAALRLGFWWEGNRPSGVLLIHELGSTPEGLGRIAERLHRAGFWTAAPALPGHDGLLDGTKLAETTPAALLDTVHSWHQGLAAHLDMVFVVGAGLGGSLALQYAASTHVPGLVTVATPARSFAARMLRVRLSSLLVGGVAGISGDAKRAGAHEVMLERLPLPAFELLVHVEAAGLEAAASLHVPTLLLHPRDDHVVSSRDPGRLFDAIPALEKELAWLEHSYHRAWIDHDRDLIADRIAGFAGALEARGIPAPASAAWGTPSSWGDSDSFSPAQGPLS